ncbi:hypothetical protein M011DRAFT_409144 [Sporormia fimetaria CBS 119925]|uniref:RING-type domain-containing protein n=1 Tax=Sporormia fimetaria CBS 119925 TaxID=1340428 RepID=A0A6A6V2S5_9PLEO|nr:hypothetical protein M011DRAFT_409144 [Sporormia fimetaria CBS 119925]
MDTRPSLTPPAKARPSTSSSSIASSKAPTSSAPSVAMASSSRTVRGTTPTGSRPPLKAADGEKPARPASKDSLKQKALKKQEDVPKANKAEEQLKALKSEFDGLRSHLTCKICDRLLYQPYTIACGHTYCYSCLCTWFVANKARKTCPDCRAAVTQAPAPAYMIREMAAVFMNRTELLPVGETVEQHATWQREEADIVQQDKDNQDPRTGGLFKGCFRAAAHGQAFRAFRDLEDGVDRCPMCGWELEDGVCAQCGLFFDENGDLTWGQSFSGFSDMDEMSEHDMSSEDLDGDMEMMDEDAYDDVIWPDETSFIMQRYLEHAPPGARLRRRPMHSDSTSVRSYSHSLVSDIYPDEMDTVEEEDEDEDEIDGDSSMNDFIDDEAPPLSGGRSVSSTPSVTPQPPSSQVRARARPRRVVESESSSVSAGASEAIEEEDEDEDEDQGPIRRGQRNRAQARVLNWANGARRAIVAASSTASTDASGEQELDEDTQALLMADGWMLQHDGPDGDMDEDEDEDEDDLSDGAQTTVGWDATANSNDRVRMGGSLTPTADRPRPNPPIRPPSRVGNARFADASRGLRRRTSVLSASPVHLEDGEADDDSSDLDHDGDIAMAMRSLRNRQSRVQLRNRAAASNTVTNDTHASNHFINRTFPSQNAIDFDDDEPSDTDRYNPRISWMFANHQRALMEYQHAGALVDPEPRSTTPIARPRTANRHRPSPAQQFSPFMPPLPPRLRTPMNENLPMNNPMAARGPMSPPRRGGPSPTSPNGPAAQSVIRPERATSVSSTGTSSSVVLTPGSSTPTSQHSAMSVPHAQAGADTVERPPSRVAMRPPSAAGRRTPGMPATVYPGFGHNNVGLNAQNRILQTQRLGNPWGAFVQPHGIRARTSRPALRDQSSTATLRPAGSRANIRDIVNPPQGIRTQTSRIDLRPQPSRRRLNPQASTRTLRASEHARPPQQSAAVPGSPGQPARPRFTPDERDTLARELINTRMRALGGTHQPGAPPARTNPFAPGFRRAADMPTASSATNNAHHIRSNSNESNHSATSSISAHGAPSSPGLARRRSSRNMAGGPPSVLSPTQGSFSPPTTTYSNAFFRSRQGSLSGSSPAYDSPINSGPRTQMVAATGQLI